MKRIIFCSFFITGLAVACSKSSGDNYTPDCSTTKSFSSDVSPVIRTSCSAKSGCHAAGSRDGVYTTYQQIYDDRAAIRKSIVNGSMPQGATLSSTEKNAIICWIDNGTTNN